MTLSPETPLHHQSGAALVIAMLLLIVLSLLGAQAMSSAGLQEQLAAGQRNVLLAETGAESALRGAEVLLWDSFAQSDGRILPKGIRQPASIDPEVEHFRTSREWIELDTKFPTFDYTALPTESGGSRLTAQPVYLIEDLGRVASSAMESHNRDAAAYGSGSTGDLHFFRISARSLSGDGHFLRGRESTFVISR
ncbi:MAG: hypothetical protein KDI71_05385 [Xanthomonadales bacterium]|nr:hypothetical protein [Xanthomonadales bacterium]